MQTTEEALWETITDSAKQRFDYQSFEALFRETGNTCIPENILLKIVAGLASGQTKQDLESELNQDMALVGLGFPDHYLEGFLHHKEKELEKEIRATKLALELLQHGTSLPAVKISLLSILS